MDTNLIKNAIRNTKYSIQSENNSKPVDTRQSMGLLSRTKNVTMNNDKPENDALRLAKMMQGKFNA